jgi:pimeloyl-ACP methyl ester carboxylesterase
MVLALRHPGSVGQLVVVDIAPVRYEDRFSEYVLAMRNIDFASPASRSQVAKRLSTSIPDAGTVAFLMQNLVTRNDHSDWRLNLPAIGGAMRELSSFPAELSGQRFDGPTTLIAGAHSDYVKPADRSVFSALFPRPEVVVIEGAGHWVHADQPEAFIQAASAAIGALT